jgi:hypothetical protein
MDTIREPESQPADTGAGNLENRGAVFGFTGDFAAGVPVPQRLRVQ